jgi:hypothetical protein
MGDIIDETFNQLSARYGEVEEQLDSLPLPAQTFIRVLAAQGVIDNGAIDISSEQIGLENLRIPGSSRLIELLAARNRQKNWKELLALSPSVTLIYTKASGNGLCALIMIMKNSRFEDGATSFAEMKGYGKSSPSFAKHTKRSLPNQSLEKKEGKTPTIHTRIAILKHSHWRSATKPV